MNVKILGNIFIISLLLICNNGYAATRKQILTVLDNNRRAIEVNENIIKDFDSETEWFIALNEYGYLIVIPVTGSTLGLYEKLYTNHMLLVYTEEQEDIHMKTNKELRHTIVELNVQLQRRNQENDQLKKRIVELNYEKAQSTANKS